MSKTKLLGHLCTVFKVGELLSLNVKHDKNRERELHVSVTCPDSRGSGSQGDESARGSGVSSRAFEVS